MARPRRIAKKRPRKPVAPTSLSDSTSIELASDEPRRRAADKKRRAYLKQLESAQRSLERFEEGDLPTFERWKAAEFGSRLTELRDAQAELERIEILIEDVEDERYFGGGTFHECYQRVLHFREHPEEAEDDDFDDEPFERASGKKGTSGQEGPEPDADTMEREIRELFSDFLGIDIDPDDPAFKAGFEDFKREFGFGQAPGAERPSAPKVGDAPPDLKQAYRSLARKLHPDHREELDAFSAKRLDELWHETQEAYAHGQIEELQRIDALIDIEANGVSDRTDIERIEQVAERHRQSLRAIQRSLRHARQHPAWMFTKKPKLKVELAQRIKWELDTLQREVQARLAYCQQLIAKWSKPPKPRQRKKPKAASSPPGRAKAKNVPSSGPAAGQSEFRF